MSWSEALAVTRSYQVHIEKMSNEPLIALKLAEDPQLQSYHRKIDSCMSEPAKVPWIVNNLK